MHNAHFIIVAGQESDDARFNVESELEEWGNENNWFDIRRIIDLSNDNDNPSDVEYLQVVVDELNKVASIDRKQYIIDQINTLQTQLDCGGRHIYWQLSEWYKELYYITGVTNPYTVENLRDNTCDEYYPYTYDEFGLTSYAQELDEGEKLFLVEVDMHS